MSTHAVLGVKQPDGSIDGCYVHYDGASMCDRVKNYVAENTTTNLVLLIAQAQSVGGIRSFHTPEFGGPYKVYPDSPCSTEFLDDNEPYVIDETNFFEDHMCTYAWYLVDYTTGQVEKRLSY